MGNAMYVCTLPASSLPPQGETHLTGEDIQSWRLGACLLST